jgi:hypothetical protein
LNAVRREGRRWASSRLSAWILYWVLVGNVDFRFAFCIALAVVIGTQLISRIGESWPSLEASSLLIFVLLAVLKNVLLGPVIPRSSARSPKARSMFLRSITDEIMYAIMELSGQEYVDIYAPAAKGWRPAKPRHGRPTRCLLRPER